MVALRVVNDPVKGRGVEVPLKDNGELDLGPGWVN